MLELHRLVIERWGGAAGVRDLAGLESAVAQPRASFGGRDLYPTAEEKAAALAYSLIQNHPFVDGNKRVGHAAMATLLLLNGRELRADVDDAERAILGAASGTWTRTEFVAWVRAHIDAPT